MRRSTFLRLEDILEDYPNLKKYIDNRIDDLKHPVYERDENVGGGRAQNKPRNPTLDMIITIEEDKRLNALERQREAIADCLDKCSKTTEKIIRGYYFGHHRNQSFEGYVVQHFDGVAPRSASRWRQKFMEDLANKLGMYDPY